MPLLFTRLFNSYRKLKKFSACYVNYVVSLRHARNTPQDYTYTREKIYDDLLLHHCFCVLRITGIHFFVCKPPQYTRKRIGYSARHHALNLGTGCIIITNKPGGVNIVIQWLKHTSFQTPSQVWLVL